ncbi:hypothetical protein ACQY1Q_09250 [Tenacibaculum sp. TC6]|uniref:hypothetical protein n=1 Tax=Tenacibaculum sp. TC6 TaxID=3423223 RepID=UPI003D35DCAF
MKTKNYLANCFLLLIPLILWNVALINYLPKKYRADSFNNHIPLIIKYSENGIRLILFILPVFMILSLKTNLQKIGFSMYILGIILYFSSWLLVIINPDSSWSQSLIGFMAPAYTTILFFVGIGLIGNKAFF